MSSVEEKVCLLGRDRSTSLVREYNSIGVTLLVEQDEDHEPLILHDLTGPIAPQPDHVEKHDDLVSFVSSEDWDAEDLDLEGFPQSDIDGQATLSSEIASMTKNLIGCGALSLANGIALSSNSPNGVFAGVFWILLFGVVFGYFCWLIAKVCQMTGHTTYRGIWQATVGLEGALAVSIANALKAALADLAYATILSDTMGSLFDAAGWKVPRTVCLLLVTICGILPLCMLENLHVLAPFSLLGTAGVVFTAGAMGIRYIDGSYKPGGIFYDDIDPSFQPEFGNIDNSWSMAILPFVCMCYEAYVMHYNSARFYTELKGKTLPRFGIAVGSSFSISAVMYVVIASFGYLTFGGNSSGYILNNYSPYDPLATISRLAIGVSTLVSSVIDERLVRQTYLAN